MFPAASLNDGENGGGGNRTRERFTAAPLHHGQSARDEVIRGLIARDGAFACFYCDRDLSEGEMVHVEHVRPRIHGGSDSLENLVLACLPCNMRKRSLPGWLFLVLQTFEGFDSGGFVEACISRPEFPYVARDRLREFETFFGSRSSLAGPRPEATANP